jgi:sigma-B regulation protein RsbU (phosphoserine phosphatase)
MSNHREKPHGKSVDTDGSPDRRGTDLGFPGQRIAEMRVDSRPECLKLVRAMVTEAATAIGCGDECQREIVLAVDEACQNVIRHAYGGDPNGEILVDVRRERDCIAIYLVDFADPVDESTVKPRPLDDIKPGGLGTHFIRQCMDETAFRTPPLGAGNCLRMVKRIK